MEDLNFHQRKSRDKWNGQGGWCKLGPGVELEVAGRWGEAWMDEQCSLWHEQLRRVQLVALLLACIAGVPVCFRHDCSGVALGRGKSSEGAGEGSFLKRTGTPATQADTQLHAIFSLPKLIPRTTRVARQNTQLFCHNYIIWDL